MVAKKLLDQREGEISQRKVPGIHFDKLKFDELAEDLLRDYRVNDRKSLKHMEIRVRHLKDRFEGVPVPNIDSARINKYIEHRSSEGASKATINRELSALKRMFSLAWQSTPPKVAQVPYFPKLKENNVRKGFFERADFLLLREALPEHLKGFVTFAYHTGWRKSEIEELTWARVDRLEGTVYLNPGETTNDEARRIYLDEKLKAVIEKQWEARKQNGNLLPYVFLNSEGNDRLKDFRKVWGTACEKIGRAGMLFHDFRRSAVRNMVRSGIQEKVTMKISGHKTRAIFDRYNIVNDEDLMLAAERQKAYLDSKIVTNTVKVLHSQQKNPQKTVV